MFFVSCSKTNTRNDQLTVLHALPHKTDLDTLTGYLFNPVSGDSITPILLKNGDSLKTGIPVLWSPLSKSADSLPQPSFQKPTAALVTAANQNVFPFQAGNQVMLDSTMFKIIALGNHLPQEERFLVNSIGDTIYTGVPFNVTGVSSNAGLPRIHEKLPPQVKENAAATFQSYDVDQGIGASYITTIIQDHHNHIWFGTDGGGICRFDGHTFYQFTEKEGLLSNVISILYADSKGNIWIGTHTKGLVKYDGNSFTNFTEAEGMPVNHYYAIREDRNGNLWFGTSEAGVLKYDGTSFTAYSRKDGLSGNVVNGIAEDADGNIWFATNGNGASKFDGKNFTRYAFGSMLGGGALLCVETDHQNQIWFGSETGGAACFDGEKITILTAADGLGSNTVKYISKDSKGNMLLGTTGGGLSIFNGASITTYGESEGLSNGLIEGIMQDDGGTIWLATYGGGAVSFDVNSFYHFTEKQGLPQRFIMSSAQDSLGNLWLGSLGGGLSHYDGISFETYNSSHGLPNNFVRSVLVDKNQNIWASCWGAGVSFFDGEQFSNYNRQTGLGDDIVYCIYEDRNGKIWFGGAHHGITSFDGKKFEYFNETNGLGASTIHGFAEDEKDNLWIATDGAGLVKFDGHSFTHYTMREGLSSNTVYCIFIDHNKNFWLGTYGGGLVKFDGETFTAYTEKQGLSNNVVWSVMEDDRGRIWAGTEKGLNCLIPDSTNKDIYNIHTFSKSEGLAGLDFFNNQVLLDQSNCMWWGSGKAFEKLDLNNFEFSNTALTPTLNELELNGQRLDYRNLSDTLKQFIAFDSVVPYLNYPLNLVLHSDYNHLTFHFAAIDWYNPDKILYQYQLAGLDETWSEVTSKTYAEYRNLPSGKFTFKVRAYGESQKWSKDFEYEFTILPPWYKTWWAYSLYAVLLILFVYLLIRWRTSKLKQRQRELERDIEKATQEIREQKEHVEEVHKEITDSINYAQRLQRTLMASAQILKEELPDFFIYFNPKEAVSGDFYWASKLANNNFALVCADSTGHGVPGAIMSMLNMNSLKEAVKEGLCESDKILNKTRETIIKTLANDGSADGGKDGMDLALLIFDQTKKQLEFSLANNPLWLVRSASSQVENATLTINSHSLIEYKPDKMPVGKHDLQNNPFKRNNIQLQTGDMLYVFTDGFADQFGGEKGKKFKYAALKELLLTNASKPLPEQHIILDKTFERWRGNLEQVDDVCVIGIRV